jgi:hypothetical protein
MAVSNITKSLPRLLGSFIAALVVVNVLSAVAGVSIPGMSSALSSLELSGGSLPQLVAAEVPPVSIPPVPYVPPAYTGNSPYGTQTGPEIPDGFVFPTRITQSEFVQPAALTQLLTCHNNTYETDSAGYNVLHSSCHHDYLAADVSVIPFKTVVVAPISGAVTIVNNPSSCKGFDVPSLSFSSDEKNQYGSPKFYFYLTHLAPLSVHHYRTDSGPWQVGEHVTAGEQIGLGGPANPGVPSENCADGATTPHVHVDVALVPNDFCRNSNCDDPLPMKERMYDPMPMLQYGFSKLPQ